MTTLKKYIKYVGGDCDFNKNQPSVIYHFGITKYDNTDELYDLNNNKIKYNFIELINSENSENSEKAITDTFDNINKIFESIKDKCKYENIIVYF